MKIPGFIFLATGHNVAKAYLHAMLELGLLPERTVYLTFGAPLVYQSSARYLPEQTILPMARKVFRLARSGNLRTILHAVSTRLSGRRSLTRRGTEADTLFRLVAAKAKSLGLPAPDFFKSTIELLQDSGLSYEQMHVSSLNDPAFVEFMSKIPLSTALYVDGGILRKPVLSTHIKLLHVHPGLVPEVKGSACLLWGALVRHRIGMSCFYMNEGIDTGDVLLTREYEVPAIPVPRRYLADRFADTRYEALIHYLDPCYRGDLLRSLLQKEPDLSKWNYYGQDSNAGRTYYHLHPVIRDKAVSLFFRVAE